ncbi:MAG: rod shape-determining protein [Lachnospiraceae bacterium]|nr:rod shape-determining protein [Lachnospiraceae bacterium]
MTKLPQQLVFGLDIGTRSIVGTVGYKNSERGFVIVAQSIRFHETRAMMDGQIHDIEKVAETIGVVKRELEQKIDRKLTEVCIAAAGRVLKTVETSCELEFEEDTLIDPEHIRTLVAGGIEKAYARIKSENSDEIFSCVGHTVVRYFLNGFLMTNLESHRGKKISADIIATFLPQEVVESLYAAVEKAGLEVADMTLEPIAAINVAIPGNYRLLNIALVDVGAGTSDICVTKDGSIVAYGMIPKAGDAITESIMQAYLVDFDTAEKIKLATGKKKEIQYKDIMGTKLKISAESVKETAEPVVSDIAKQVSDKIIELNGGKPVSAVFVVGGGGKFPTFIPLLAENLGIAKERVALRGAEVLDFVTFPEDGLAKDSTLVTPIGICLNYYEAKNNIIFVTLNKERIKLYDNGKTAVMDAAAKVGFPNDRLFARTGKALNYTFNGERRMARGEMGDAAVIKVNGKLASISTIIGNHDEITIKDSTSGKPARLTLADLKEAGESIVFNINGKDVKMPRLFMANGKPVGEDYRIADGDSIVRKDFYLVSELLTALDMERPSSIEVNHVAANPYDRVYENFTVDIRV